jgi:hypothetical protein
MPEENRGFREFAVACEKKFKPRGPCGKAKCANPYLEAFPAFPVLSVVDLKWNYSPSVDRRRSKW